MESSPDTVLYSDAKVATAPAASAPSPRTLPPKGSCWYCDKPLDNVRRFCGAGCRAAFDEDAALHG